MYYSLIGNVIENGLHNLLVGSINSALTVPAQEKTLVDTYKEYGVVLTTTPPNTPNIIRTDNQITVDTLIKKLEVQHAETTLTLDKLLNVLKSNAEDDMVYGILLIDDKNNIYNLYHPDFILQLALGNIKLGEKYSIFKFVLTKSLDEITKKNVVGKPEGMSKEEYDEYVASLQHVIPEAFNIVLESCGNTKEISVNVTPLNDNGFSVKSQDFTGTAYIPIIYATYGAQVYPYYGLLSIHNGNGTNLSTMYSPNVGRYICTGKYDNKTLEGISSLREANFTSAFTNNVIEDMGFLPILKRSMVTALEELCK